MANFWITLASDFNNPHVLQFQNRNKDLHHTVDGQKTHNFDTMANHHLLVCTVKSSLGFLGELLCPGELVVKSASHWTDPPTLILRLADQETKQEDGKGEAHGRGVQDLPQATCRAHEAQKILVESPHVHGCLWFTGDFMLNPLTLSMHEPHVLGCLAVGFPCSRLSLGHVCKASAIVQSNLQCLQPGTWARVKGQTVACNPCAA